MAYPQKYECSQHKIRLCPENKEAVLKKWAELKPLTANTGISQAINVIISEWEEMKKGKIL